jgi:hypothetical protein
VLPAIKHAAEELRCLGVSGAQGAGPSLRQAARSAAEVLRAGDQTSQQISKLHADAMRVGIAYHPNISTIAPRPTFVFTIDRTFHGLCNYINTASPDMTMIPKRPEHFLFSAVAYVAKLRSSSYHV